MRGRLLHIPVLPIAAPGEAGAAQERDLEQLRQRIRGAIVDFIRQRRHRSTNVDVYERKRGRVVRRGSA